MPTPHAHLSRRTALAAAYSVGLAATAVVLVPSALHAQEAGWAREVDSDGIVVHTRAVRGSAIREFRAAITVKAPLARVAAIIEDPGTYPRWYGQVRTASLIAQQGNAQTVYFLFGMPFPLDDRDIAVVQQKRATPSSGALVYDVAPAPSQPASRAGVTRMPTMTGSWTLEPISATQTRIIMQQHGEFGGSMPAGMINMMLSSAPKATLDALRSLLERRS